MAREIPYCPGSEEEKSARMGSADQGAEPKEEKFEKISRDRQGNETIMTEEKANELVMGNYKELIIEYVKLQLKLGIPREKVKFEPGQEEIDYYNEQTTKKNVKREDVKYPNSEEPGKIIEDLVTARNFVDMAKIPFEERRKLYREIEKELDL